MNTRSTDRSTVRQDDSHNETAHCSTDINPVKRKRGRPPGSKNKKNAPVINIYISGNASPDKSGAGEKQSIILNFGEMLSSICAAEGIDKNCTINISRNSSQLIDNGSSPQNNTSYTVIASSSKEPVNSKDSNVNTSAATTSTQKKRNRMRKCYEDIYTDSEDDDDISLHLSDEEKEKEDVHDIDSDESVDIFEDKRNQLNTKKKSGQNEGAVVPKPMEKTPKTRFSMRSWLMKANNPTTSTPVSTNLGCNDLNVTSKKNNGSVQLNVNRDHEFDESVVTANENSEEQRNTSKDDCLIVNNTLVTKDNENRNDSNLQNSKFKKFTKSRFTLRVSKKKLPVVKLKRLEETELNKRKSNSKSDNNKTRSLSGESNSEDENGSEESSNSGLSEHEQSPTGNIKDTERRVPELNHVDSIITEKSNRDSLAVESLPENNVNKSAQTNVGSQSNDVAVNIDALSQETRSNLVNIIVEEAENARIVDNVVRSILVTPDKNKAAFAFEKQNNNSQTVNAKGDESLLRLSAEKNANDGNDALALETNVDVFVNKKRGVAKVNSGSDHVILAKDQEKSSDKCQIVSSSSDGENLKANEVSQRDKISNSGIDVNMLVTSGKTFHLEKVIPVDLMNEFNKKLDMISEVTSTQENEKSLSRDHSRVDEGLGDRVNISVDKSKNLQGNVNEDNGGSIKKHVRTVRDSRKKSFHSSDSESNSENNFKNSKIIQKADRIMKDFVEKNNLNRNGREVHENSVCNGTDKVKRKGADRSKKLDDGSEADTESSDEDDTKRNKNPQKIDLGIKDAKDKVPEKSEKRETQTNKNNESSDSESDSSSDSDSEDETGTNKISPKINLDNETKKDKFPEKNEKAQKSKNEESSDSKSDSSSDSNSEVEAEANKISPKINLDNEVEKNRFPEKNEKAQRSKTEESSDSESSSSSDSDNESVKVKHLEDSKENKACQKINSNEPSKYKISVVDGNLKQKSDNEKQGSQKSSSSESDSSSDSDGESIKLKSKNIENSTLERTDLTNGAKNPKVAKNFKQSGSEKKTNESTDSDSDSDNESMEAAKEIAKCGNGQVKNKKIQVESGQVEVIKNGSASKIATSEKSIQVSEGRNIYTSSEDSSEDEPDNKKSEKSPVIIREVIQIEDAPDKSDLAGPRKRKLSDSIDSDYSFEKGEVVSRTFNVEVKEEAETPVKEISPRQVSSSSSSESTSSSDSDVKSVRETKKFGFNDSQKVSEPAKNQKNNPSKEKFSDVKIINDQKIVDNKNLKSLGSEKKSLGVNGTSKTKKLEEKKKVKDLKKEIKINGLPSKKKKKNKLNTKDVDMDPVIDLQKLQLECIQKVCSNLPSKKKKRNKLGTKDVDMDPAIDLEKLQLECIQKEMLTRAAAAAAKNPKGLVKKEEVSSVKKTPKKSAKKEEVIQLDKVVEVDEVATEKQAEKLIKADVVKKSDVEEELVKEEKVKKPTKKEKVKVLTQKEEVEQLGEVEVDELATEEQAEKLTKAEDVEKSEEEEEVQKLAKEKKAKKEKVKVLTQREEVKELVDELITEEQAEKLTKAEDVEKSDNEEEEVQKLAEDKKVKKSTKKEKAKVLVQKEEVDASAKKEKIKKSAKKKKAEPVEEEVAQKLPEEEEGDKLGDEGAADELAKKKKLKKLAKKKKAKKLVEKEEISPAKVQITKKMKMNDGGPTVNKLQIDIQPLPSRITQNLEPTKPAVKKLEKHAQKTKRKAVDIPFDQNVPKPKKIAADDYIPLEVTGPTKFGVTPLNKFKKAVPYSHHAAADFKNQMLYGNRIKRMQSDSLKVFKEKRKFLN